MAHFTICSVAGCGKPHHAFGYCSMHHSRLARHGSLKKPGEKTIQEAFDALFIPEPNSGCWLWIGNRFSMKRSGYGCFTCRQHGILNMRAHRAAWSIFVGDIADDKHVLHKCDNPLCVNPDHLFLGDQPTNMADKVAKGRQPRGEDHAMRKLTEEAVRDIRASGEDGSFLAYYYGVSHATICDVRARRSWAHI